MAEVEVAAALRRRAPRRGRGSGPARWLSSAGLYCALFWLGLVVLAAVLAPVLPLSDPIRDFDFAAVSAGPSWSHPLGADQLGRDVLSRLVWGSRVALTVGLGSVLLGAAVGTALGLASGYVRGKPEAVVLWLVDSILAFPALVLAIALVAYIGPSVASVTIAIGIVAVPTFARISRASTLAFSQREFVLGARSIGLSDVEVVWRELLPNVAIPVGTYVMLAAALAIVTEGALGFLGLSVAPPAPSWGGMVASGRPVLQSAPHLSLFPATTIFLTVISLNLLGRHLQARFDLRSSVL